MIDHVVSQHNHVSHDVMPDTQQSGFGAHQCTSITMVDTDQIYTQTKNSHEPGMLIVPWHYTHMYAAATELLCTVVHMQYKSDNNCLDIVITQSYVPVGQLNRMSCCLVAAALLRGSSHIPWKS